MPDDLSTANGGNGGTEGGAVATAVRQLIQGVRAGEPLRAGGLTLIPLLPATEQVKRQSGYLPLEEALQQRLMTITEQAQATVPELVATSTADAPVVLVGGEQVIGGLQNRVLNTTILVAAHVMQPIPVTCVEAGRWHEASAFYDNVGAPTDSGVTEPSGVQERRARAFQSDEAAYATLRRMHAKSVTSSLASGGGHRSDQGAVWGEVSARMMSSGSYSPSSAMDTLYKTPERAGKLKETVEALKRPEGALGFVAVVGQDVLGAEIFTDERLADAYWQKLARSYAVEALDAGTDDAATGAEAGNAANAANVAEAQLLADALAADIQVHPSPGLGEDARLTGSHVSGAGLVYDGAVVHLSLFPEETPDAESAEDVASVDDQLRTRRHYGGHR